MNSLDIFKKKMIHISNLMKIRPMETEQLHSDGRTDGRTDRYERANSRFS